MNITGSIWIQRPLDRVFTFAANNANDWQWREGLVEMQQDTAGTVRTGTRTREVIRFLGQTYTTECVVARFDKGHGYSFKSERARHPVSGTRVFEPELDGTRYTANLQIELRGGIRLFTPLLARLYRRRINRDLRALKRLLETDPTPAAPLGPSP